MLGGGSGAKKTRPIGARAAYDPVEQPGPDSVSANLLLTPP
jgi:hypothetical protein